LVLGSTIGDPNTSRQILNFTNFGYIIPGQPAGNLGRNTFRKGPIFNVNASIAREWKWGGQRAYLLRLQADAYNLTMYVMTGLLLLGFLCNAAIRRVGEESYMTPDELEAEQRLLRRTAAAGPGRAPAAIDAPAGRAASPGGRLVAPISWLLVLAPLAWGIASTLRKGMQLFR